MPKKILKKKSNESDDELNDNKIVIKEEKEEKEKEKKKKTTKLSPEKEKTKEKTKESTKEKTKESTKEKTKESTKETKKENTKKETKKNIVSDSSSDSDDNDTKETKKEKTKKENTKETKKENTKKETKKNIVSDSSSESDDDNDTKSDIKNKKKSNKKIKSKKSESSSESDSDSECSKSDSEDSKSDDKSKKLVKDTKKDYDKILQKYYGYNNLKDLQYEIIKNIIDGNDVVSLLPTSYGKSICYQMPYLITKKNVIVISPLISLMEDQTRELNNKNIPSICLNSSNKQKAQDIDELYKGNAKIIYTTPEYLANNSDFIENLAFVNKLALVAIYECHCISSWGHSFRSEYKNLSIIKELAPDVPVLALTATATEKVIQDVIKNLDLDNPKIIKHSVDRPNLYLEINYFYKKVEIDITINKISQLIKENTDGKVLIYCKTVTDTDKVAEKLNKLGFDCESYHAQKKPKERTEIQKKYTEGDLDIIVSTIAFGMGINIPNIRLMIHYNCSNDVESYMQEIGRAGRDGKKSKCIMFGSKADFLLNEKFLEVIKNKEIKKNKVLDIKYLEKYANTSECRRKCLLKYFEENMTNDCGNCDNCIKSTNAKYTRDFTKETFLLFSLIAAFNNNFGMMTYIKLLLGSKDKQLDKYKISAKNQFGKGNCYSEDWWIKLFNTLITNGYLTEEKIKSDKFTYCVIKMLPKATTWFNLHKHNEQNKKPTIEIEMPESFKSIDVKKGSENEDDKIIEEMKKKFNIKKVSGDKK
jgi:RecQ family ATP-dependent DNA helicase